MFWRFRAFSSTSYSSRASSASSSSSVRDARARSNEARAFARDVSSRARSRRSTARARRCLTPSQCVVHVVLVALEYDAEPFSGNGILAQALVRGLSSIADVFVACARPVDDDDVDDDHVDDDDARVASTTLIVRRARVPRSKWFTLTVDGAHAEFARRASGFERRRARSAGTRARGDFSSRGAAEALGLFDDGVPFAYAPFRLFSRSDARHLELERGACERAKGVLALCASDGRFVAERLRTREDGAKISVMHPPLRKRISELASTSTSLSGDGASWERRRGYLTCVVRVSEERRGSIRVAAWRRIGATRRVRFGRVDAVTLREREFSGIERVRARAHGAVSGVRAEWTRRGDVSVARGFGRDFQRDGDQRAPSSHDAFGMTVVEAAAFGAPTMLHADGDIGAAEFLRPGVESIGANMEASARDVADRREILVDPNTRVIAAAAASRALAWDESSFAESVCNFLMSLAT